MNTESIRKSNPPNRTTLNTRPIFNPKAHKERGIVRACAAYRISFKGSLPFSGDFVVFIVADEFESCFYELAYSLF